MSKRKTTVFVGRHDNDESQRLYWQKCSAEQRLSAVEFLREQFYLIAGFKTVPRLVRSVTFR
ncbi:MAG: hypothetical protein HY747_04910 [Elusimicrobia bacterium]|nr:hypothetical protein [Elusimicrobiota bacterium]